MEGLKLVTLLVLIATLVVFTNMKPCSGDTNTNATTNTFETYNNYIETCCNTTIYKTLCVDSLSSYSTKIKSRYPKLVYTAINLSLVIAKSTLSALLKLSKQSNLQPNEVVAITDCVENVGESVDELKMSMEEFENLNATDIDYKMSNIMTWVSAALTNDDTCLDGLGKQSVDPAMQAIIRENVTTCGHMTSNVLALVNNVDYSQLYNN